MLSDINTLKQSRHLAFKKIVIVFVKGYHSRFKEAISVWKERKKERFLAAKKLKIIGSRVNGR
jgi:hypothetical protein